MKDKKVVFMGTPEFSIPVLEMLIENTNVIMVVTQPDSFVGHFRFHARHADRRSKCRNVRFDGFDKGI